MSEPDPQKDGDDDLNKAAIEAEEHTTSKETRNDLKVRLHDQPAEEVNDLDEMELKILALTSETKVKMEFNMDLEKEVLALELERRKLRDAVAEIEEEEHSKRRAIIAARDALQDTKKIENSLLHQLESLRNGQGSSTDEALVYKHRTRNTEVAIEALQMEAEDLRKQIISLDQRKKKQQASLNRLQGLTEGSIKSTRKLEATIRQTLDAIGEQHTKSVHQETLVSAIQNESSLKERILADAKENTTSLRLEVVNSERENNSVKSFIFSKSAELAKIRNSMQGLSAAVKNASQQLSHARATSSRNAAHLSEKEGELANLSKESARLDLELHLVAVTLRSKKSEQKHAEQALKAIEDEIEATKRESEQIAMNIANLHLELKEKERTNAELLTRLGASCRADQGRRLEQQQRTEMTHSLRQIEKCNLDQKALMVALKDALKRTNVHRWRELETKDPERMALLLELQKLRKQYIAEASRKRDSISTSASKT